MIFLIRIIIIFFLFSLSLISLEVRLKDIAKFEGIRDNQITGFGLVIGLSGTGDTKSTMTPQTLKNYLKKLNINADSEIFKTNNVASVLITATIPSYARLGDKIDVTVSSIGDAKSLEGGILLQSPLLTATEEIYAVASGSISLGGKAITGQRSIGKSKNKTTGIIRNGAIIEKELIEEIFPKEQIIINVYEQDYSLMNTIVKNLKEELNINSNVISNNKIEIYKPTNKEYITFLSEIENLIVETSFRAKVVINERTGTIVMGGDVKINEVAVSKDGLNISIANENSLSYFDDSKKTTQTFLIEEATKVSDVVDALNKVGATTKDIIAILEALKKSGALIAELVVE